MASTFSHLVIHCVFSTKGRAPLIHDDLGPRLHAYMGGVARGAGATSLDVGGVDDHVHLLLRIRPITRVADLVREIKSSSSKWVNEQESKARFAWQAGYSAFTVSASNLPRVSRSIRQQRRHHRRMSFADELRELLRASGVDFDEEHLLG